MYNLSSSAPSLNTAFCAADLTTLMIAGVALLLTNSKPFLHSIRSKAHSGVQVNLSSKEIRDTDVIIAPKNVNDGFNTFVKPIFDRIMVNQLENLTLNELKQTLLNRLF